MPNSSSSSDPTSKLSTVLFHAVTEVQNIRVSNVTQSSLLSSSAFKTTSGGADFHIICWILLSVAGLISLILLYLAVLICLTAPSKRRKYIMIHDDESENSSLQRVIQVEAEEYVIKCEENKPFQAILKDDENENSSQQLMWEEEEVNVIQCEEKILHEPVLVKESLSKSYTESVHRPDDSLINFNRSTTTDRLLTTEIKTQPIPRQSTCDGGSLFLQRTEPLSVCCFDSIEYLDCATIESFRQKSRIKLTESISVYCFDSIEYLDCATLRSLRQKSRECECQSFLSLEKDQSKFIQWMESTQNKMTEYKKKDVCKCFHFSALRCVEEKTKLLLNSDKGLEFENTQRCLNFALLECDHVLICYLVKFGVDLCVVATYFTESFSFKYRHLVETIIFTIKLELFGKGCLQTKYPQLGLYHDTFRRNELVIIISYFGSMCMLSRKRVNGIQIVYRDEKTVSEETKIAVSYNSKMNRASLLPSISKENAERLFKKHSNLSLISAAHYISKGYHDRHHRFEERSCINLFCKFKGYVPIGEKEFPRYIGEYEVDVLEDVCFFANDPKLQVGKNIYPIVLHKSGTIGGFISLPDNNTGLITCSHVLYSLCELQRSSSLNESLREGDCVLMEAHNRHEECGKIVKAVFSPNTTSTTSVDAALVLIDSNIHIDESFPDVSELQIKNAGFQLNSLPTFNGAVVTSEISENDRRKQVIKYGAVTGLTIGMFHLEGAHVRMEHADLTLIEWNRYFSCTMFSQIEIRSPMGQPFFGIGDSGAFVFMINEDQSLTCIGMAIGLTPAGSCLVTPIKDILNSLNLPLELKSISGERHSSHRHGDTGAHQIPQDFASILGTIVNRLDEIRSEVKEVKDTTKNELQQVRLEIQKESTTTKSEIRHVKNTISEMKIDIQSLKKAQNNGELESDDDL